MASAQITDIGGPQPVAHQRGGDTHAVEDVADIVQHARGDLGHARISGGVHQLPVELVQLLRVQFLLGDVLEDAAHGHGLAFLHQHRAALPDPDRPAIGGNHPVFVAVGLTPGGHVVAGLNGFGGVLRVQFLLPKFGWSNHACGA